MSLTQFGATSQDTVAVPLPALKLYTSDMYACRMKLLICPTLGLLLGPDTMAGSGTGLAAQLVEELRVWPVGTQPNLLAMMSMSSSCRCGGGTGRGCEEASRERLSC
jgi:hypothetical protein